MGLHKIRLNIAIWGLTPPPCSWISNIFGFNAVSDPLERKNEAPPDKFICTPLNTGVKFVFHSFKSIIQNSQTKGLKDFSLPNSILLLRVETMIEGETFRGFFIWIVWRWSNDDRRCLNIDDTGCSKLKLSTIKGSNPDDNLKC